MRTLPLLADFIHSRAYKPICAKLLTLPAGDDAGGSGYDGECDWANNIIAKENLPNLSYSGGTLLLL